MLKRSGYYDTSDFIHYIAVHRSAVKFNQTIGNCQVQLEYHASFVDLIV